MPKLELPKSIPEDIQGLNYKEGLYELKDHVWEEALNSNLLQGHRPIKRIILTFSQSLIKKHLNWICIFLCSLALP